MSTSLSCRFLKTSFRDAWLPQHLRLPRGRQGEVRVARASRRVGPSVFEDTVKMVDELRIDIPRYALYTPFPGTDSFPNIAASLTYLSLIGHWCRDNDRYIVELKHSAADA